VAQSQDFRDRAKADENIVRPSRAEPESLRPSQAEAGGRRGKAKARQAEKLPRGGLEPRQLPLGLHLLFNKVNLNELLYALISTTTLSVCGVGSRGVVRGRGYIGYIYSPKISPSKLFVG